METSSLLSPTPHGHQPAVRRRSMRLTHAPPTPFTHVMFLDSHLGQWLIRFRRDFVVDPEGDAINLWLGVVALAVLYNIWSVILRIAFIEMRQDFVPGMAFTSLDILSDAIFIIDIFIQFRMGYLEDGILVKDSLKLADNYVNCRRGAFVRDVMAAMPVPGLFVLIADGVCYPLSRLPKLLKYHTMVTFISMWDMKTNNPNIHRACKLLAYLATTIHWIGCFYYIISEAEGHGSNEWVIQKAPNGSALPFSRKYLCAIYWSTMTLTTIGETWGSPSTDVEYIFTGLTFLIGVFMFATVVGNVGDVISNMNAGRVEFQQKMDVIKFYMTHHNIPEEVQNRVKKWAEYSWNRTQAMDDQSMLEILPYRLRAEIAKHVHLDTLQKVKIFEECEKGLLLDLVVRLRTQIYSPGDYICRKGEIGREMYIINHGKVEVIIPSASGEPTVVAILTEGNYFGEISLLRLADGCNRRNADVKSVGYSELLVLSKRDLILALVEYPEARGALERQARDRVTQSDFVKRMQRIREEQRLSVLNPDIEGQDSDPDDPEGTRRLGSRAKAKEREMSELRHVLNQLKSLDSQMTKSRLDQLQDKCRLLEAEVRQRDSELRQARRHIAQLQWQNPSAHVRLENGLDEISSDDDVINRRTAILAEPEQSGESDCTVPDVSCDVMQGSDIISGMLQTEREINSLSSSPSNRDHGTNQSRTSDVSTNGRVRSCRPARPSAMIIPGIAINDVVSQEPQPRPGTSSPPVGFDSRRPSVSETSSDWSSTTDVVDTSGQREPVMTDSLSYGDTLMSPDRSFSMSDLDYSELPSDISDMEDFSE